MKLSCHRCGRFSSHCTTTAVPWPVVTPFGAQERINSLVWSRCRVIFSTKDHWIKVKNPAAPAVRREARRLGGEASGPLINAYSGLNQMNNGSL